LSDGFPISNIRRPFRLNYSGQKRKQNLRLFHGCQYPIRFEGDITVRLIRMRAYKTRRWLWCVASLATFIVIGVAVRWNFPWQAA
jgi:hypothetical protein